MALPLPYRPKAVDDFMQEELNSSISLRINKKDLFMEGMFNWYRKLSTKNKKSLTRKILDRKSVSIAYKFNLPWDNVPTDWLRRMKDEVGLICYITPSALARRRAREQKAFVGSIIGKVEADTWTPPEDSQSAAKKFYDLTSLPPPAEWTAAKERDEERPRLLAIGSNENETYHYWDYDMSHWKLDDGIEWSQLSRVPTYNGVPCNIFD